MKIVSATTFAGPNIHAQVPAVRLLLDMGRFAEAPPSGLGERFNSDLSAFLPEIAIAPCLAALARHDATALAQLVAEIALELQRSLGAEVGYRDVRPVRPVRPIRPGEAPRLQEVVYESWDAGVAAAAGPAAVGAVLALIDAAHGSSNSAPAAWNAAADREKILARLRPESLDLITAAMVREATRRGIPWYRPVARKPFVQFGQGRHLKHIRESATCDTSAVARYFSKDKNATSLLLARVGLPVPAQELVTSADDAVAAAERLGYPVVTKPLDRGNGKGVSVHLTDAQAVRWGFGEALRYNEQIVIERYIGGDDHRMLIIDGVMVAAAKRIPGHVVGDGRRSIAELVDAANQDPRRGNEYEKLMVRLALDAQAEQVLSDAGLSRDSVPRADQIVPLRRTANVSTGGTCVDVTDTVHPDNRDAAIRACGVLGLNIAGVDFLTTDISRSYREIGGGMCEVNFSPGLRPHWNANPARDVVGPIIETLFARGAQGRIPLAAVTGGSGKTATARMLAHILSADGRTVGVATRLGARIGSAMAVAGDMSNDDGARSLLFDPAVEAAVLACSVQGILERGLGFRDCDVAGVLGLAEAPSVPAPAGITENRVPAARVLIGAATRVVVLDGDDPMCLEQRDAVCGPRICLASHRSGNAAVEAHIAAGGSAARLEGRGAAAELVIHEGRKRLPIVALAHLATEARSDVRSAVFAVALARGLGVSVDQIRAGLATLGDEHA